MVLIEAASRLFRVQFLDIGYNWVNIAGILRLKLVLRIVILNEYQYCYCPYPAITRRTFFFEEYHVAYTYMYDLWVMFALWVMFVFARAL